MAHFKIEPVIDRVCGHHSDRFTRQELVVWLHCHSSQPSQDRIVASGDLKDQDLTILMVRAGIKNFAIGRGYDLGPGFRGIR